MKDGWHRDNIYTIGDLVVASVGSGVWGWWWARCGNVFDHSMRFSTKAKARAWCEEQLAKEEESDV